MMSYNIVLQLQNDILINNADILDLLRKAYLIARKLKLHSFEDWIKYELNGYSDTEIPKYRMMRGLLKAWNPYHGWIDTQTSDNEIEELLTTKKISTPIGELQHLSLSDKSFCIPVSAEQNVALSAFFDLTTKYALFITQSQLVNIIELVKNKLLDWSLLLEENDILGEGVTFSIADIEKAQSTPTINNYTNNFFGSLDEIQGSA